MGDIGLFNCGICFFQYNTVDRVPKYLLCFHTFCNTCLKDMVKERKISCPFCRHETRIDQDVNISLRTNRDILSMIESIEKSKLSKWCIQCNKLAADNCNHHITINIAEHIQTQFGNRMEMLENCQLNWKTATHQRQSLRALLQAVKQSVENLEADINQLLAENDEKLRDFQEANLQMDLLTDFSNPNTFKLLEDLSSKSEKDMVTSEKIRMKFSQHGSNPFASSFCRIMNFRTYPAVGLVPFQDGHQGLFNKDNAQHLVDFLLAITTEETTVSMPLAASEPILRSQVANNQTRPLNSLIEPKTPRFATPPPIPSKPPNTLRLSTQTPINFSGNMIGVDTPSSSANLICLDKPSDQSTNISTSAPNVMPRTIIPTTPRTENQENSYIKTSPNSTVPLETSNKVSPAIQNLILTGKPLPTRLLPGARPPSFNIRNMHISSVETTIESDQPKCELGPFTSSTSNLPLDGGFEEFNLMDSQFPTIPREINDPTSISLSTRLDGELSSGRQGVIIANERLPRCMWSPKTDTLAATTTTFNICLIAGNGDNAVSNSVTLQHYSDPGYYLHWNQSGTSLVTGTKRGCIRLWTETGGCLYTQKLHNGEVLVVKFNEQGNYLCSGGADQKVVIWDLTLRRQHYATEHHTAPVCDIDWKTTCLFATCSLSGEIYLLNTGSDELYLKYEGHSDAVNGLSWDPEKDLLLSWSADSTMKIWTVHNKKALQNYDFKHRGPINTAEWSKTGRGTRFPNATRYLASGSDDGTVVIWDYIKQKPLHELTMPNNVTSLSFSPDGQMIATADSAGIFEIWETKNGRNLKHKRDLGSSVSNITWNSDGTKLGLSVANKEVVIIDIKKPKAKS